MKQNTPNTPNLTRGQRLQHLLIDPFKPLDTPAHRTSQILSGFTLLMVVISLPIMIGFIQVSDIGQASANFQLIVTFVTVIVLFMAHLLSRAGYLQSSLWLTLLIMTVPLLVLALEEGSDYLILIYTVLPLIIGGYLLSVRAFIVFALSDLLAILALPLFDDKTSFTQVIVGPVSVVGACVLVILVFAISRGSKTAYTGSLGSAEATLTQMMHFNPQMVAVYAEGVCLYINPAGVKLLGAQHAEDIIGQPISTFMAGEASTATISAPIEGTNHFATSFVDRLYRQDGSTIEVTVTAIPAMIESGLATQIFVQQRPPLPSHPNLLHDTAIKDLLTDYTYTLKIADNIPLLINISGAHLADVTGYSVEEAAYWQSLKALIHPADWELAWDHWQDVLKGKTRMGEYRILTRQGETRWVRDYACPISPSPAATPSNTLTALVQDVTEYMHAEIALRAHALQQAVVAELGQRALVQNISAEVIIKEAVMFVSQILDVEYSALLEHVAEENALVLRAAKGWSKARIPRMPLQDSTEDSQAAYTYYTKQPVIVPDMLKETRFNTALYLDYKIVSGMSVVIHGQHEPIGVLGLHTIFPRQFTTDDLNFVQSIANIVGTFMEQDRIRTIEREQRILAEALSQLSIVLNSTLELNAVLDRLITSISQVVAHDTASIMLVEGQEARVLRHVGFERHGQPNTVIEKLRITPAKSVTFAQMLETHAPVIITDVRPLNNWFLIEGSEWIRSYLGVPIIYADEVIGVINVDSAQVDAFTPQDGRRLQAFAAQASIALRNAHHATELERRINERTRELESQRRGLQTIIDSSGEGIFYAEDSTILYANETFCQMLGYAHNELHGQSAFVLLFPNQQHDFTEVRKRIRATLAEGSIYRSEIQFRRKDGSTLEAGITVSLAEGAESKFRTVTIVRDITGAKALEAQQARFIANASHELRNPIMNLNTRIYMMKRDRDRLDYHLDLFEKLIERINKLVSDLLDISHFENGVIQLKQRDLVLQTLLQDVYEMHHIEAQSKQIGFYLDMPEHPLSVSVDPDRIFQVLTNLIINAMNHTPENGRIVIRATLNRDTDPPVVVVEVRDTGAGIAAKDLDNIFQPFFRADKSKKGSGLGLSIAREIIHLHGGRISVESELGKGSCFAVSLPLHQAGIEGK